jgi:hypothetical protein
MSLPPSDVVTVDVNLQPVAAPLRSFRSQLIIGSSAVVPVNERVRPYASIEAVAAAFAASTPEYKAAALFFAQKPRAPVFNIGRRNTGETPLAAAQACVNAASDWYGMAMVDPAITTQQHIDVSAYIEGLGLPRLYGITTQEAAVKDITATTDIASQIKALARRRTMMQYSSTNPYAVVSAMARELAVDFSASRSAITMKFKQQPGVVGEALQYSEAQTLKAKLCNVYAKYNNGTTIFQEGVTSDKSFIDEVHGLDWLQNNAQTRVFNLFYQSNGKIAQTDEGLNQIAVEVEAAMDDGVRAGLIAPGIWNADGFGELSRGQFLPKGYYLFVPEMATQNQADREARIAPTIQVAVKLAGAVHKAYVIINVNR